MITKKIRPWLSLILVLFLVQLACYTDVIAPMPPTALPSNPTARIDTSTPGTTPTVLLPTETPTNTSTPTGPLVVTQQGFGQEGQEFGFGFLLKNTTTQAYDQTFYKMIALDASGAQVDDSSGEIGAILPGQELGIGGLLLLNDGVKVEQIKVEIEPGETVATSLIEPLSVSHITYLPSDINPQASGVVSNPYDLDMSDLHVYAVAFNAAGEIIGGGLTYLNFIPAGADTAVICPLNLAGQAAQVRLYAEPWGFTALTTPAEIPADVQPLQVIRSGYGLDGPRLGFGMVVQNPNQAYALSFSQYHASFYAADGRVLYTVEGSLDAILPGQTVAFGDYGYLAVQADIARADFQVKMGVPKSAEKSPGLSARNIQFFQDSFNTYSTADIVNPYGHEISDILVVLVAYDADGNVIGGGNTSLDSIPAGGRANVEVNFTSAKGIDHVEIYAMASYLQDYGIK